ncbi:hypothetical protein EY01_15680, partial [Staphylococcus aureus]
YTNHIINDGVSIMQLMKDLNALSQHKLFLPLNLQYKYYSELISHLDMTEHIQYCLYQFKVEVPIISLLTDYVRPIIKTTNGTMMTITINQQMRHLLKTHVENHQITDFMTIMSVATKFVRRHPRKNDVVIRRVMSAPMHTGTEQMLGRCANTLE